MIFLPIVERELRVAARRPATYRTRFFGALSVVVVWLFLLGTNRFASAAQLSQTLFVCFGVLALAFAILAGVFVTADCLSEEKREETLGLLFLTDLRGYDVVLGKLAATSLHSVYGLLAVFPMLALPVLMGGVTGAALGRVVLVLVVTVFLSLSLGIFVSALSREAREAMAGTLAGLLFLAAICPALHWAQFVLFHRVWTRFFLLPSPGYTFLSALDAYYARGRMFWASLRVVGWLGVMFLILAALLLPRVWAEKSRGPRTEVRRDKSRRAGLEGRTSLSSSRRRLGSNPFLWLASRKPGSGKWGLGLAALVFGIWLCFLIASVDGMNHRDAFVVTLFAAFAQHVVFKCLAAIEATRQLSEDRRSGALELLLVSPLKETDILAGQWQALTRYFRRWVALLVVVNLAMSATIIVFADRLMVHGTDFVIFQELFLGGILALALDFKALGKVGMWMALRANRHYRAVLGTCGRVLVPSWAGLFLLVFYLNSLRFRGGIGTAVEMLFAGWFIFGLAVDFVMIFIARASLQRGFRAYLTAS